jgi:hypothetical protein
VDAGATLLEWDAVDRAIVYNVYRGTVSQLATAGAVRTSDTTPVGCATNGDLDLDGDPDFPAAGAPSSNQVSFYLVTAENRFGESPLAPPGTSPPRVNDAPCP